MISVVFVGDKASSENLDESVPFVGARCFNRLVEWITAVKPDYYIVLNSDTVNQITQITLLSEAGFKVIALGHNASKRLGNTPHFKINHPSSLNRNTNDKKLIEQELFNAYLYVRGVI